VIEMLCMRLADENVRVTISEHSRLTKPQYMAGYWPATGLGSTWVEEVRYVTGSLVGGETLKGYHIISPSPSSSGSSSSLNSTSAAAASAALWTSFSPLSSST
jgi:hypothetical protein